MSEKHKYLVQIIAQTSHKKKILFFLIKIKFFQSDIDVILA